MEQEEASASDESRRIAALKRYNILDTPPEGSFDDITLLASQLCQTPIALISLLDETRQWFKSKVGLDVDETPRSVSFCSHVIMGNDLMEVKNALNDDRFKHNPLVTGEPDIRFYAGFPLTTGAGIKLGTLCVIDRIPRELSDRQKTALSRLGKLVVEQIELKHARDLIFQERAKQELILNSVKDGLHGLDLDGNIIFENAAGEKLLGYEKGELIGKQSHSTLQHHLQNGEYNPILQSPIYTTLRDGQTRYVENEVFWRKDGTSFPVEYVVSSIASEKFGQVGAIITFHDATKFLKAKKAHGLLASIVDSASDAIMGFDLFGEVTSWNRGAEKMFGYASEEIVGKPISIITPQHLLPKMELKLDLVKKGKDIEAFESFGITKSGTMVKLSVVLSPVKNEDNKVVGVSNVSRVLADMPDPVHMEFTCAQL
jgi:PAS domain S-box-containing protein